MGGAARRTPGESEGRSRKTSRSETSGVRRAPRRQQEASGPRRRSGRGAGRDRDVPGARPARGAAARRRTDANPSGASELPPRNRRTAGVPDREAANDIALDAPLRPFAGVPARLAETFGRARRPLAWAGKVLLVIAAVGGAVATGRLAEDHVRTSPAFATREVLLSGNEKLAESEVVEAAGLAIGQNVFAVGPEDAAARLERHPWIASAHVVRRLPGSFEIAIRERAAVALLSLGPLYLVGDDATVFKRVAGDDPIDLPIITGIERDRFTRDRAYRTSILLEAVALMHDYRAAGLWRRMPISEIHVERDDALTLYSGEETVQIRLGRGPFRDKLRKLRQVMDRLERQSAQPAYVYLDNVRRPDRVTVRLR